MRSATRSLSPVRRGEGGGEGRGARGVDEARIRGWLLAHRRSLADPRRSPLSPTPLPGVPGRGRKTARRSQRICLGGGWLLGCMVLLAASASAAGVDAAAFRADLEALTRDPSRVVGSPGYDRAGAYIEA